MMTVKIKILKQFSPYLNIYIYLNAATDFDIRKIKKTSYLNKLEVIYVYIYFFFLLLNQ